MATETTSADVFEAELPQVRAKILEVAAALDRIDRAGGTSANDSKTELVRRAIETLLRPSSDRAEQVQLLFSRPFEDDWRQKMEL